MRRLFLGALLAAATAFPAAAHEFKAGDLTIDHPYARASAGPARNGAAYLTIRNDGTAADRLVGGAADVADKVELHTHINDAGVMRMREVEGGIEVPPGEAVAMKPGGLHVMFFGLKQPLKEGESFPLTLTFERAGSVEVTVQVEAVAAGAGGHRHH